MACIKLLSGERKGARIDIDRDEFTIGRSPANVVHLDDPSVSGYHCVIQRKGRRFTLLDLDSTNGTRLNGVRIKSHGLSAGDAVTVGEIELHFEGNDIDNHVDDDIPPTIVQTPAKAAGRASDTVAAAPAFKKRRSNKSMWFVIGIAVGAVSLVALVWFIRQLVKS